MANAACTKTTTGESDKPIAETARVDQKSVRRLVTQARDAGANVIRNTLSSAGLLTVTSSGKGVVSCMVAERRERGRLRDGGKGHGVGWK